ncbi:MAG: hypothetical protein FWF87_04985 [Synergistaceae bacterium]|nr:hypothetical protein [Synergistaceae bacterium]
MKKLLFAIMILACSVAAFANSDMLARLAVIANSGGEEIFVDQFINGTEDYYIATIVRPISTVNKDILSKGMLDIIESFEDLSEIYMRELNAYSKTEKSSMTLQRSLVKKPYYESSIFPDIVSNPQLVALEDNTVEKQIWEGIAGEGGLGCILLSDDHEPVSISEKKEVLDTDRYSMTTKRDGMGVYLDVNSIIKTPDGCIAWIIEPVSENLEAPYGELIANIIGRPFQRINLMMIRTEFDFTRPVCKTRRYIYFGKDNKIIYSSLSANTDEINVSMEPALNAMYNYVKDFVEKDREKTGIRD